MKHVEQNYQKLAETSTFNRSVGMFTKSIEKMKGMEVLLREDGSNKKS